MMKILTNTIYLLWITIECLSNIIAGLTFLLAFKIIEHVYTYIQMSINYYYHKYKCKGMLENDKRFPF